MRTLAAILAYLMAAASGLAVGYYTTAPRTAPPLVAAAAGERHAAHTGRGGPADLDAVAAYLAAEEQREDSAPRRTSAGL